MGYFTAVPLACSSTSHFIVINTTFFQSSLQLFFPTPTFCFIFLHWNLCLWSLCQFLLRISSSIMQLLNQCSLRRQYSLKDSMLVRKSRYLPSISSFDINLLDLTILCSCSPACHFLVLSNYLINLEQGLSLNVCTESVTNKKNIWNKIMFASLQRLFLLFFMAIDTMHAQPYLMSVIYFTEIPV